MGKPLLLLPPPILGGGPRRNEEKRRFFGSADDKGKCHLPKKTLGAGNSVLTDKHWNGLV